MKRKILRKIIISIIMLLIAIGTTIAIGLNYESLAFGTGNFSQGAINYYGSVPGQITACYADTHIWQHTNNHYPCFCVNPGDHCCTHGAYLTCNYSSTIAIDNEPLAHWIYDHIGTSDTNGNGTGEEHADYEIWRDMARALYGTSGSLPDYSAYTGDSVSKVSALEANKSSVLENDSSDEGTVTITIHSKPYRYDNKSLYANGWKIWTTGGSATITTTGADFGWKDIDGDGEKEFRFKVCKFNSSGDEVHIHVGFTWKAYEAYEYIYVPIGHNNVRGTCSKSRTSLQNFALFGATKVDKYAEAEIPIKLKPNVKVPIRMFVRKTEKPQTTSADSKWNINSDFQCLSKAGNKTTVGKVDTKSASRKTWSTTKKNNHHALTEVGAWVEIRVVVTNESKKYLVATRPKITLPSNLGEYRIRLKVTGSSDYYSYVPASGKRSYISGDWAYYRSSTISTLNVANLPRVKAAENGSVPTGKVKTFGGKKFVQLKKNSSLTYIIMFKTPNCTAPSNNKLTFSATLLPTTKKVKYWKESASAWKWTKNRGTPLSAKEYLRIKSYSIHVESYIKFVNNKAPEYTTNKAQVQLEKVVGKNTKGRVTWDNSKKSNNPVILESGSQVTFVVDVANRSEPKYSPYWKPYGIDVTVKVNLPSCVRLGTGRDDDSFASQDSLNRTTPTKTLKNISNGQTSTFKLECIVVNDSKSTVGTPYKYNFTTTIVDVKNFKGAKWSLNQIDVDEFGGGIKGDSHREKTGGQYKKFDNLYSFSGDSTFNDYLKIKQYKVGVETFISDITSSDKTSKVQSDYGKVNKTKDDYIGNDKTCNLEYATMSGNTATKIGTRSRWNNLEENTKKTDQARVEVGDKVSYIVKIKNYNNENGPYYNPHKIRVTCTYTLPTYASLKKVEYLHNSSYEDSSNKHITVNTNKKTITVDLKNSTTAILKMTVQVSKDAINGESREFKVAVTDIQNNYDMHYNSSKKEFTVGFQKEKSSDWYIEKKYNVNIDNYINNVARSNGASTVSGEKLNNDTNTAAIVGNRLVVNKAVFSTQLKETDSTTGKTITTTKMLVDQSNFNLSDRNNYYGCMYKSFNLDTGIDGWASFRIEYYDNGTFNVECVNTKSGSRVVSMYVDYTIYNDATGESKEFVQKFNNKTISTSASSTYTLYKGSSVTSTNMYPADDNRSDKLDSAKKADPVLAENGDNLTFKIVVDNYQSDLLTYQTLPLKEIYVGLAGTNMPVYAKYAIASYNFSDGNTGKSVTLSNRRIIIKNMSLNSTVEINLNVRTNSEAQVIYGDKDGNGGKEGLRSLTASIRKIRNCNSKQATQPFTNSHTENKITNYGTPTEATDYFRIKSYNVALDKYITAVQHVGTASNDYTYENWKLRRTNIDWAFNSSGTENNGQPIFAEYGDYITYSIVVYNTADNDYIQTDRNNLYYNAPQYIRVNIKDNLPNYSDLKVYAGQNYTTLTDNYVQWDNVRVPAGGSTVITVRFRLEEKTINKVFAKTAQLVSKNGNRVTNINGYEVDNKNSRIATTEYIQLEDYNAILIEYLSEYYHEMATYDEDHNFIERGTETTGFESKAYSSNDPLDVEKHETYTITSRVTNIANGAPEGDDPSNLSTFTKYNTKVRPTQVDLELPYGIEKIGLNVIWYNKDGSVKQNITSSIRQLKDNRASSTTRVWQYYITNDNIILSPGEYIEYNTTVEVTESNMYLDLLHSTSKIRTLTNVNRRMSEATSTNPNRTRVITKENICSIVSGSDYIRLKDIIIAGRVWEEDGDKEDGYKQDGEKDLSGIKVNLYATTKSNYRNSGRASEDTQSDGYREDPESTKADNNYNSLDNSTNEKEKNQNFTFNDDNSETGDDEADFNSNADASDFESEEDDGAIDWDASEVTVDDDDDEPDNDSDDEDGNIDYTRDNVDLDDDGEPDLNITNRYPGQVKRTNEYYPGHDGYSILNINFDSYNNDPQLRPDFNLDVDGDGIADVNVLPSGTEYDAANHQLVIRKDMCPSIIWNDLTNNVYNNSTYKDIAIEKSEYDFDGEDEDSYNDVVTYVLTPYGETNEEGQTATYDWKNFFMKYNSSLSSYESQRNYARNLINDSRTDSRLYIYWYKTLSNNQSRIYYTKNLDYNNDGWPDYNVSTNTGSTFYPNFSGRIYKCRASFLSNTPGDQTSGRVSEYVYFTHSQNSNYEYYLYSYNQPYWYVNYNYNTITRYVNIYHVSRYYYTIFANGVDFYQGTTSVKQLNGSYNTGYVGNMYTSFNNPVRSYYVGCDNGDGYSSYDGLPDYNLALDGPGSRWGYAYSGHPGSYSEGRYGFEDHYRWYYSYHRYSYSSGSCGCNNSGHWVSCTNYDYYNYSSGSNGTLDANDYKGYDSSYSYSYCPACPPPPATTTSAALYSDRTMVLDLDVNGDGSPDLNIDTNGDKVPDVNIDTTGDGQADMNIDTTGDGQADTNVYSNIEIEKADAGLNMNILANNVAANGIYNQADALKIGNSSDENTRLNESIVAGSYDMAVAEDITTAIEAEVGASVGTARSTETLKLGNDEKTRTQSRGTNANSGAVGYGSNTTINSQNNKTLVATVYTRSDGTYSFGRQYKAYEKDANGNYISDDYVNYYIEFEYDGVYYKSTDVYGGVNLSSRAADGTGNLTSSWIQGYSDLTSKVRQLNGNTVGTDKYLYDSNAYEFDDVRIAFDNKFKTIGFNKAYDSGIALSYTKQDHESSLVYSNDSSRIITARSFISQDFSKTVNSSLANTNTTEIYGYSGYHNKLPETEYMKYINLGLVKRNKFDISQETDVYEVKTSVNGEEMTYHYNENPVDSTLYVDGKLDPNTYDPTASEERDTENDYAINSPYELALHEADYNYRYDDYYVDSSGNSRDIISTDNTFVGTKTKESEMEVQVTYRIRMHNDSTENGLLGLANELAVYYDENYMQIDNNGDVHIQVKNATTGLFEDKNIGKAITAYLDSPNGEVLGISSTAKYPTQSSNYASKGYGALYVTVHDNNCAIGDYLIPKVESTEANKQSSWEEVYIRFTLDKVNLPDLERALKINESTISTNVNNDTTSLVTEITAYTTRFSSTYRNKGMSGSFAGLIDKDSNPGNVGYYDINDDAHYEDDTYRTEITIISPDSDPRTTHRGSDTRIERVLKGSVWDDARSNYTSDNGLENGSGVQYLGNGTYNVSDTNDENAETNDAVTYDNDQKLGNIRVSLWEMVQVTKDGATRYYEHQAKDSKGNLIETMTASDGSYTLKDFIPGYYIVRFNYGDDEDGQNETYNGQDYKSTTYREIQVTNGNTLSDNFGATRNYNYFDDVKRTLKEANYSDARDDEIRRLNVNAYSETMTSTKAKSLEALARVDKANHLDQYRNANTRTNMFADSSIFYAKPEEVQSSSTFDIKGNTSNVNHNNSTNNYNFNTTRIWNIGNFDFGLEYRPEASIVLDKQIENIKLITSDNKTILDINFKTNRNGERVIDKSTSIGLDNSQFLPNEEKKIQGFVYINADSSILEGTTLKVKYSMTATNSSEVDRVNENLEAIQYETGANRKGYATSLSTTLTDASGNPYNYKIYKQLRKNINDSSDNQYMYTATSTAAQVLGERYYGNYDVDVTGEETYDYMKLLKRTYNSTGQTTISNITLDGKEYYGMYLGEAYYHGGLATNATATFKKDTVTELKVDNILDYIDNDFVFNQSENSSKDQVWEQTTSEKLLGSNYIDREFAYINANGHLIDSKKIEYDTENKSNLALSSDTNKLGDKDETDNGNVSLSRFLQTIKESNDAKETNGTIVMEVSKVLSSEDLVEGTGLDFENIAEVIQYTTVTGRRTILPNATGGGIIGNASTNRNWTGYEKYEDDTDAAEIIMITPPTGLTD